jgi:hypothetical protein
VSINKIYIYQKRGNNLRDQQYVVNEEVSCMTLFYEHLKKEFKDARLILVSINGGKS